MDYFDEVNDIIQSMIDDYQWGNTTITGKVIYDKLNGELNDLRYRFPYTTVTFDDWFIDWADMIVAECVGG
jgi:hypothetical protein